MADNLDIRARLTAEDSASATIQGLINRVKQLEKQIKTSFAPNKITGSIVSPKVMKDLQGAGKEINGLTKKYKDMARETRDLGNMNGQEWLRVTNDIKRGVKNWKAASGESQKVMARDLKEKIKYAQAYRSLYNAEHRDHLKAIERHQNAEGALQVAHMRRMERMERQHMNQRAQARRNMMRGIDRISNVGGRGVNPIWYGVGAAYGAGRMASSSIRSATDLDRAEANARINMDQSVISGRDLRNWAMPKSVDLGQQPARFMQTAVEAAKAGVPEAMAQGTAEMVTMLAKTFGVEVDQAMDGMGYAIAQEMGAGRLKDMKGINNLGNITAFLAAKTAARPDQMFSFLRTGMGSGAMLGMSQEATLAFGAAGIQAGAQGQQTARFLGSIGETLAGLTMEARTIQQHHGSRSPKDRQFLGLPAQLGYGGYADIENGIRKSPDTAIFNLIKSFGKIKDPLKREQAMTSMFGADFARFLANMISSPEMLDRTLKLAKEAAGQKEGANFVSEAWGEFTKSLEFFVDRVKATWSVVKSELGDVLKPFIQQFSDWITDWYRVVKTGGMKERFKAVLDGLTEGFLGGPGTFRDLLERAFGKPGEGNGGNVDSFFKYARGFATGLKEFASGFVSVMQTMARYFGGGDDAEAMGKFTAKILGLVAALTALGPVIGVFTSLVGLIGGLVAIFGGPAAIALGAATAAEAFSPDSAKRRKGEKYDDYIKRRQDHKKSLYQKQSGEGFDPGNIHPASYLSNSIDKFNGTIQRVAFMSGGGGINNGMFYSGGSAGGGGGGGGGVAGRFSNGAGTPGALLNSVPGAALPDFGMGANGIIKRGGGGGVGLGSGGIVNPSNVLSFNGGGGSSAGDGVGAGQSGNAFLAARRTRFNDEINNDPNLRLHLAAMQATEGASKGGTIESLFNRADMQGKSLRQMLGYSADGRINLKSFYGPIRRGELGPAIERLKRNPKEFAKYDAFTQNAIAGGHVIGGYTDQGLATDPNGSARTGIKGFKISPRDGNEFQDWVGPGSSFGRGRQGAMNYRKFIEQGIAGSGPSPVTSSVPTPAEAIQNVPPSRALAPNGDASMGGNRGNVAIHINGGSHDPESLATLVQRRVDESMNWRAHDSESEYT
jgi:TP901 family phage tail tape measure protein